MKAIELFQEWVDGGLERPSLRIQTKWTGGNSQMIEIRHRDGLFDYSKHSLYLSGRGNVLDVVEDSTIEGLKMKLQAQKLDYQYGEQDEF